MSATKEIVDNEIVTIIKDNTKKRAWEIDFIRGILILFVITDHLMVLFIDKLNFNTEVGFFLQRLAQSYYAMPLRKATHKYFLIGFVLLSGISSSFSRNNIKRGAQLGLVAILFSLSTLALKQFLNISAVILFNVIHVIATSILINCLIKLLKIPKGYRLILGIIVIVIGERFLLNPAVLKDKFWFFLVENNLAYSISPADFMPLFPYLGWFMIGSLLGEKFYAKKQTLYPLFDSRKVSYITFLGKHTLVLYFGCEIVFYIILFMLTSLKIL